MGKYSLPYGFQNLDIIIPDGIKVDVLEPEVDPPLEDPYQAILTALHSPMGKAAWADFQNAKTIGIAINDKTRPISNPNPIVPLLEFLAHLGFRPEQITLFVASGTHTPMASDEVLQLVGSSIADRYKILVHDCDHSPMVDLGPSYLGNPIQINADFYHCDLKIAVGNIEPHHFMGFSGGVKTAAIGLASRETIEPNHAMLTHPQAKTGVYDENPLRKEVEEIGQKAGVQFCLSTILSESKQIQHVFFGDPLAVMSAAIPVVRRLFGVTVPLAYDLVITSPGGMPKDINLYQSQKAITHAARITRDGGWVILVAACPEGSGSQPYEDYITTADSHQKIIEHFAKGFFKVGPHKALQIAKEAVRINIILVSDQPQQIVESWKLTPSNPHAVNTLLQDILSKLTGNARIAILPAGTRTMTEVKNG